MIAEFFHNILSINTPPNTIIYPKYLIVIISVFTIVVNCDADKGWTNNLFKKSQINFSEEFIKAKDVIEGLSDNAKPEKWVDWADSMGYADKELKKFLSDVDSGKRDIKDMGLYMDQASGSSSAFGDSLKKAAANIAITLAVVATIKLVATALD